jgi:hypothetical protein
MSLHYIAEQLFSAVETLATHDGSIKERFSLAHFQWISRIRLYADHLPTKARELFDSLEEAVNKVQPSGDEGTFAATVRSMSEAKVKRMIQRVISLLEEVVSELARLSYREGQYERAYNPTPN